MKTFHQLLVEQFSVSQLGELKNHCFVFPTKRGGVFFKRALLAAHGESNFMLPAILSIEEFVQRMTGLTITDELTLLFHLFKIYQKKDSSLQFDDFYAWGKIILKDYDEIDRYMADAKKIYSALQNIKEIDHVFGYSDEFREIIARYRTLTEKQEKTKLLTEFLKIWKEVGAVYEQYQETLLQEEKAYGGMLYRNLANVLTQESFDHRYVHYHFCGFNALSKSEELIFDALVKSGKAQLYWDADSYYLQEKKEEAGNFLREYTAKWPKSLVFDARSLEVPKQVTLHSVSQNMAQAQLGARLVTELIDRGAKPEETAIVLADEKLLVPLLYAMPAQKHKINVTMGYPMRSTVVFDFVLSYLELMRKARQQEGEWVFHTFDLRPLLANPYAAVFHGGVYQEFSQWAVREKRTKVSQSELTRLIQSSQLSTLWQAEKSWEGLYKALKDYLTAVFYTFKEQNTALTDQEFIYFLLKSLNQLNDYLEGRTDFSLKLIKKIIQEHFRAVKIPFEGEPVQGIQIMGFLETRTLDFKQVVVLSANEGKLPTARNLNSYIPYGLRRVFGLPTFEEQDAIYAYHFKRLMQRAEQIHWVYDNTTEADSSGEKSRFILQQLKRYAPLSHYRVEEKNYEGWIPDAAETEVVEVQKSEEVMRLLGRFTTEAGQSKFLSPTSLTNYVTCPLKFYLKNVAGFKEQEDVEEDIDARNLGIVVHEVLEYLYRPWVGRSIGSEQIKLLKAQVEKQLIDSLHRNKIIQDHQQLTGRDLVTKEVMEQLIQKVLDLDMADAPFEVIGLEEDGYEQLVKVEGKGTVRISGTIDRIDEKDGVLRITDYKTGRVDFVPKGRSPKTDEEILELHFNEPKYKSGFQAYLYAVLVRPHVQKPIKVGITTLKSLREGTQWLKGGETLDDAEIEAFSERLQELVQEIYDVSVPFTQTDDLERCSYCEFTRVCKRG
ncbi:PD-(D/E)XK nuclease family protein [Roseivirga thermotolerans]|uniref:PD-(D/E)XK nuclease family protein n=1 Tax=Roseivirga thermotolerans TaxID=1758176 RepID=UPI0027402FC0|nr:PD-(D/E)XK nuclease family protein [Roseivirga thermotolerans]MEC7755650.1 PD-(D/E)XK nuclease family protein [Bacteroidota bacterium]